jgi:transcriptional regulator
MAKQQSFAEKAAKQKQASARKTIKLIYSVKSPKSGSYKFSEKFLQLSSEIEENSAIEEFLQTAGNR